MHKPFSIFLSRFEAAFFDLRLGRVGFGAHGYECPSRDRISSSGFTVGTGTS
jgi:hypothetical protein